MDATAGQPKDERQAPTWVDNWQRLGLVNATNAERLTGDQAYDWVQERPEYTRLAKDPSITKLGSDKGLIRRKDFGQQFLRAVTE
jgi:hypothetical protein